MDEAHPPGKDALEGQEEDQIHRALADELEPGERVVVAADALLRVALQLFHRCGVALTDRRLILLKPSWPWGYKLDRAMSLEGCFLVNEKDRFDGSRLMVLKHRDVDGIIGLYFGRRWRDHSDAIVGALTRADPPGD